MSIRRKVLEHLAFEPYLRSTQYLDLMLQRPNNTEKMGSDQCKKKVKLIGVTDLKEPFIGLIQKKIKSMIDSSGCHHQGFNYRGYPIVIKFDGPIRSDFYLTLINEPEKHIEFLKVTGPKLGL